MSDYSGPASGEDFDPEVEMTPEAMPDNEKSEDSAPSGGSSDAEEPGRGSGSESGTEAG